MFITEHDDGSVTFPGSFNRQQWDAFLAEKGLDPSDEADGVPLGLSAKGEPVLPAPQPGPAGVEDADGGALSERLQALAESEESNTDATASVEPPAGNASAEEWRTYAVSSGQATDAEVPDMSRNDLRDAYGSKE